MYFYYSVYNMQNERRMMHRRRNLSKVKNDLMAAASWSEFVLDLVYCLFQLVSTSMFQQLILILQSWMWGRQNKHFKHIHALLASWIENLDNYSETLHIDSLSWRLPLTHYHPTTYPTDQTSHISCFNNYIYLFSQTLIVKITSKPGRYKQPTPCLLQLEATSDLLYR